MNNLEYISFHPVKKIKSLIGFCSFRYNKEISFNEIAVHKLLNPKGNIRVRLVYPEKKSGEAYYNPSSRAVQLSIDEEISNYIQAKYKEHIK